MPISWRLFEGVVFLESGEEETLAEWQAAVRSALFGRANLRMLHDARRRMRTPDVAEVKARLSFLIARVEMHRLGRCALVVGNQANYGLGRMAEALVETNPALDFRVFMEMAEAKAWLAVPALAALETDGQ